MTDDAEAAGLLAARFHDLFRNQLLLKLHPRAFLLHPWESSPPEQREAMTAAFAQLILEAREQREEWTRAFIEAEAARLREEIELRDPGALRRLGARNACGYSVILDPFETPTETLRDCTGDLSASASASVPDVMSGADFVRLKALDAQVLKAGRRLLQLRDSLQSAAGVYRVRDEGEIRNATTAERLNLFAVELESIVYEAGLAERPKEEEGSAEG